METNIVFTEDNIENVVFEYNNEKRYYRIRKNSNNRYTCDKMNNNLLDLEYLGEGNGHSLKTTLSSLNGGTWKFIKYYEIPIVKDPEISIMF